MELKCNLCKKWNFFKITTTYRLLNPCFFLYKCFGLHPYVMNKKRIISSQLRLCYSIFSTIISTIYLFIVLYQVHISKAIEFDTIEGIMQFDCYLILATFIVICACICSSYRLSLLNQILELSTILYEKELISLAVIIYIKNTIGFIFLLTQTPNIYIELNMEVLIAKSFALYLTFIVFLTDFQYSSYVLILKSCFKNINNNLLRLKENSDNEESNIHKEVKNQPQVKNLQLIKLRKLQQKHHEVCIVVNQLNSTFTLHIVATVLMTFAEVTFGLYFFLLHSQGAKNIDIDKQIWYNYFLTSVIYHSIKITIIVWICQVTKSESLKTGIIVHDVILNNSNDLLKTELCLFSLQLLQCNNDFTSKCIVMDAKLITSMVSGIATYLLILMQFLKTKSSSKNQE